VAAKAATSCKASPMTASEMVAVKAAVDHRLVEVQGV